MHRTIVSTVGLLFMALAGAAQSPVATALSVGESVAAFAEAHMGRKVGRGECWDLAQYALDKAGARWDGRYRFGDPVHAADARRGDIVQFEHVLVERRTPNRIEQERMGPHTAVVLVVEGPGRYVLAHQNFGKAGRKVSRYTLVMDDVRKGTISFFRPVR